MTSQPLFPAPVGQVFEISFVTFMARAPVGRPPDRLQGSAATGPHRGASPATSPRRTRPPHRPSLPASKRSPGHEAAAPPEKTRPRSRGTAQGHPGYPDPAGADLSNTNLPEQEFRPRRKRSAASAATTATPAVGTPGSPSPTPNGPPRCSPPCSRPPASTVPRSRCEPSAQARAANPGRCHDSTAAACPSAQKWGRGPPAHRADAGDQDSGAWSRSWCTRLMISCL